MEEGGSREHDQLISATKALAGYLFQSFNSLSFFPLNNNLFPHENPEKLNITVDNHKNLKSVKGSDELVRKLKDLFSDFEEHEEKLRYFDIATQFDKNSFNLIK